MKTIKGDVVGISYKFDILGVPLFAFKASRNAAKEAELYFQNNHIAFVDDPHTAQIIFNNGELSNAIPKETFSPVGRALITSGIIKNSDDSEE
jgi:type III secretory pathway component EscU